MYAAGLRIELRIRGVRSLKEKRRVVKPILVDLHRNLGASVAETAHQDSWQRCEIGVAVVASAPGELDRRIDAIRRRLDEYEVDVLSITEAYLEET